MVVVIDDEKSNISFVAGSIGRVCLSDSEFVYFAFPVHYCDDANSDLFLCPLRVHSTA